VLNHLKDSNLNDLDISVSIRTRHQMRLYSIEHALFGISLIRSDDAMIFVEKLRFNACKQVEKICQRSSLVEILGSVF
jgi:hypothetical protein